MSLITLLTLGSVLIISSLGVILVKKPVHAALSFLLTLFTLSALYLQLSAHFIAAMQVLVYAGAILVIFMFVIVLFQDAHEQIDHTRAKVKPFLLLLASIGFIGALLFLASQFIFLKPTGERLADDFGTVEAIGKDLYIDFFFPFEAVILLFLIAVVGALYIGRKQWIRQ